MTKAVDRDYYARRADEERRVAEAAENDRIAALHRDLAARYEKLAAEESDLEHSQTG